MQLEVFVVEKNTAPSRDLGAIQPDRLLELLSSFSRLRTDNRHLVDQIRGSIGELRELRNQLRTPPHSAIPISPNEANHNGSLERRFNLTPREAQVARLLARGRSNLAIAGELNISAHTTRHHTQRILAKLGVHSHGVAGAKIRS
jgi:DNA-binding NarL/FixJ family response regulator